MNEARGSTVSKEPEPTDIPPSNSADVPRVEQDARPRAPRSRLRPWMASGLALMGFGLGYYMVSQDYTATGGWIAVIAAVFGSVALLSR